MAGHSLTLQQKLREFARSRRRHIGTLTLVRGLWLAVLGALTLVYADLLFILPADARLGLAAVYGLGLMVVAAATYRVQVRAASEARLVARLVEQGSPGLHNDFINAVDFEDALAGAVRPELSRELMTHEIAIASDRVSAISSVETLKPSSLRGESRLLFGVLAASVVLGVLFAGVFAAILPRYLDPWGDHPPYSPTRLTVIPADATVEYGANQVIKVAIEGRKPDEMALVLEDHAGKTLSALPMLDAGDGTYFQTIENVRSDLVYHAEIPRGRSKRYALTLSKTPRIDSVAVTYTYPEYTHLPSKTRLVPKDDATVAGYSGTRVRLDLASNRPLQGGPVDVGGKSLSLIRGTDENTATVEFPLEAPGSISARLVDIEGIESKDVFRGRIEVVPDKRPEVAVVSPGKHSFAIPDAKVPIVIEARDDLGVKNVALIRSFNGSNDARKDLYTGTGAEIFTSQTELMDMADLGVRPGDVIEYYATATDTLPDSPQTASTPAFQIVIVSFEAYRDFMQKQTSAEDLKNKYDALYEKLEALSKAQETLAAQTRDLEQKLATAGTLSDSERQLLTQTREKQDALAKQAGELAKELKEEAEKPAIFDIEEEYKKALNQFAERVAKAQELMQAGRDDLGAAETAQQGDAARQSLQQAQQHQQEALEQIDQSANQFKEQIQQANRDLERLYKLLNDVEQFKQLYGAQQMLERQARTYKDVRSPDLDQQIRLKELAQGQDEIRKALEQLKSDLGEHAAEVKEEYPKVAQDAEDIAKDMEALEIPSLMESASGNLSAANAPQGHEDAHKAMEAMKSMIAFCEAMQGDGNSQCELRLKIRMSMNPGNTLSQLSKSLGAPGFGFGQGTGDGAGMGSSATPFDLYGSELAGRQADREDPASSRRMHNAQAQPAPAGSLAGSFEELSTSKNEALQTDAGDGEHVVEEYRPLIEAYFRSLAEEKL